jgi:hypothetical protein
LYHSVALKAAGPVWTWEAARSDSWETGRTPIARSRCWSPTLPASSPLTAVGTATWH